MLTTGVGRLFQSLIVPGSREEGNGVGVSSCKL